MYGFFYDKNISSQTFESRFEKPIKFSRSLRCADSDEFVLEFLTHRVLVARQNQRIFVFHRKVIDFPHKLTDVSRRRCAFNNRQS